MTVQVIQKLPQDADLYSSADYAIFTPKELRAQILALNDISEAI
jgi:hypothetical protein